MTLFWELSRNDIKFRCSMQRRSGLQRKQEVKPGQSLWSSAPWMRFANRINRRESADLAEAVRPETSTVDFPVILTVSLWLSGSAAQKTAELLLVMIFCILLLWSAVLWCTPQRLLRLVSWFRCCVLYPKMSLKIQKKKLLFNLVMYKLTFYFVLLSILSCRSFYFEDLLTSATISTSDRILIIKPSILH